MTFPNDSRSPMDPIDPRTTTGRDTHLHTDPVHENSRSSGSKMALMALAVLAILGVVMYGMNSGTDTNTATNTTPATSSTQSTATTGSTPTTGTPAGENTGTAPPATRR